MQEFYSMGSKVSLPRDGARRTGPRGVRVYFRQVTGSRNALGSSTTCRTSTSFKPEVLGNVHREYEKKVERPGPSVMSCISRNSKFIQTNYSRARRLLLLVVEEGEVIDAFHRGTPILAPRKLLGDIPRDS